jgi:hypothetical protein
MSNEIMQSNFLVELNDEQQENLAGGMGIGAIDLSSFTKLTEARLVETSANGMGSSTKSASIKEVTKTTGLSELFFKP